MIQNVVLVKGWPKDKTPEETEIRKILADEGLQFYQWSNRPGDVYGAHDHPYHKVICGLQGSITFGLPDRGDKVILKAGDRLGLPAGTSHDKMVGDRGVICLEAHPQKSNHLSTSSCTKRRTIYGSGFNSAVLDGGLPQISQ